MRRDYFEEAAIFTKHFYFMIYALYNIYDIAPGSTLIARLSTFGRHARVYYDFDFNIMTSPSGPDTKSQIFAIALKQNLTCRCRRYSYGCFLQY